MRSRGFPTTVRCMQIVLSLVVCLSVGVVAWGIPDESGQVASSVLGPSARHTSSILVSRGLLQRVRPVNLTRSPADERCPVWSPTGDLIAFTANGLDTNGDGRLDTITADRYLYTMSADGTGLTGYAQALPHGSVQSLAWLPDGRALIVLTQAANRYAIFSLQLNGRIATAVCTLNAPVGSLAVAPDEKTVFFDMKVDGGWQIYAQSIGDSATTARRLTAGPFSNRGPAIATNGAGLLFVSNRSGHWRAYRMPLNGGQVQPLTTAASDGDDLAVKPTADGKQLILVSTRRAGLGDCGITPRLWIMPNAVEGASAGTPVNPVLRYPDPLAANASQCDPAPQSAADGEQTMLFVSNQAGTNDIYLDEIVAGVLPTTAVAIMAQSDSPLVFARLAVMQVSSVTRARTGSSITFSVTRPAAVSVLIRSRSGRTIRQLADGFVVDAGQHTILWDGKDNRQRIVPPGVYLSEITACAGDETAHYTGMIQLGQLAGD